MGMYGAYPKESRPVPVVEVILPEYKTESDSLVSESLNSCPAHQKDLEALGLSCYVVCNAGVLRKRGQVILRRLGETKCNPTFIYAFTQNI